MYYKMTMSNIHITTHFGPMYNGAYQVPVTILMSAYDMIRLKVKGCDVIQCNGMPYKTTYCDNVLSFIASSLDQND